VNISALEISSTIGLIAAIATTVNICLGLLIAVRYDPQRDWPRVRLNIFAIHNSSAYPALVLVAAHPLLLLAVRQPQWTIMQIALPAWSPVQPAINSVGALGLYLLIVLIVSSYFRRHLGFRRWKVLHYLVYAAAACIFIHGILANPTLSAGPIDPLDGEKLLVEGCLLVVIAASISAWRIRARRRFPKR
jgi:DMSO/TMAO reductase YedYZ heme-binding membrane subunit